MPSSSRKRGLGVEGDALDVEEEVESTSRRFISLEFVPSGWRCGVSGARRAGAFLNLYVDPRLNHHTSITHRHHHTLASPLRSCTCSARPR